MIKNKIILVIQARMSSTRLPGKILKPIKGLSILEYLITRVNNIEEIDEYWVATSSNKADDIIEKLFKDQINVYRGDEQDVLGRYYDLATQTKAKTIIRITADCPFSDPSLIKKAIQLYNSKDVDYLSNVLDRSYPDGLDIEIFSYETLKITHEKCNDISLREHVTPYMKTNHYNTYLSGSFKTYNFKNNIDFSHLRWTLDTEDDYSFLTKLAEKLDIKFSWMNAVSELTKDASLLSWNRDINVRTGALSIKNAKNISINRYTNSNKLFDKAINIIPLASQTFSKSFQQYVKGAAPLFAEKAKGAILTDIDGNEYIDYVAALLPVILGYCDPDIDSKIIAQLNKGITFSLASDLEYQLADKLVNLIPSAEMVRFGKNGSDVTSAAIRLARAHTGRDMIAVAGYHGWHDWYIGSTTRDVGVPNAVKSLTTKFSYDDLDGLKKQLDTNLYAAIILEPYFYEKDSNNILKELRSITNQTGTVLIFDEIISGFRINIGGAQSEYNVIPDISTFGKSMANGMPISAIAGNKKIMSNMNEIFFSSTFGGEALSLVASIETINKIQRTDAINKMKKTGTKLILGLNAIIDKTFLKGAFIFQGPDWWPRLNIVDINIDITLFKSLLRQELNAAGLILNATLNLSLSHTEPLIIEETLIRFKIAIDKLSEHIQMRDPKKALKGDLMKPTFSVRP
ncbi:aminotransferase class III-fold pyridoxal phosphate-dependent enzyme [Alphaproteobacteria bacterium]|nr:aminotransferase class III-fold pyridoxal phosphate-dependent enzyme [Alphaproteobacteria bacterium]